MYNTKLVFQSVKQVLKNHQCSLLSSSKLLQLVGHPHEYRGKFISGSICKVLGDFVLPVVAHVQGAQ